MDLESGAETGAQAVARVVARETEFVFGIPGGYMMRVFDALRDHQDRVRTMLVREEALASVMSEAFGRVTGRPTVVMGQGAWVLGNAGIGIMEAQLGSSPVVVLVDATEGGEFAHHGPYQSGSGHYGAYDIRAGFAAITKRTFLALTPVQAAQMTQLAFKHATTGEPGPVAVVYHSAALLNRIDPQGQPRVRFDRGFRATRRLIPQDDDLNAAAAAVRSAARPVIIAGSGVRLSNAYEALADIAEQVGIPVATTSAGKGVFDETSDLALGVIGTFGHACANAVVGAADLVLAVGTKLGSNDTVNENPKLIDPDLQVLVHIDVEPLNLGWTQPDHHEIVGDAGESMKALTKALTDHNAGGARLVQAARARHGYFDELAASTVGLRGRRIAQLLARHLPANAVVTCDAGENRLFMLHDYRTRSAGSLLQPSGGGGMGYAIPAAMASCLADPSRPAVAVCGDGGFAMTLHGLMTAVEQDLPIMVVVMDNGALGWVLNSQGGRPFASKFHDFDLAAIAAAMGCIAHSVGDEESLVAAVAGSLDAKVPSVIVAQTNLDDTSQHLISPLSGRSVESLDDEDDGTSE